MQEEGPLCQKCGALLAPGWGHLLGDPNEVAPGEKQRAIVMKQQCRNELGMIIMSDSDDDDPF